MHAPGVAALPVRWQHWAEAKHAAGGGDKVDRERLPAGAVSVAEVEGHRRLLADLVVLGRAAPRRAEAAPPSAVAAAPRTRKARLVRVADRSVVVLVVAKIAVAYGRGNRRGTGRGRGRGTGAGAGEGAGAGVGAGARAGAGAGEGAYEQARKWDRSGPVLRAPSNGLVLGAPSIELVLGAPSNGPVLGAPSNGPAN